MRRPVERSHCLPSPWTTSRDDRGLRPSTAVRVPEPIARTNQGADPRQMLPCRLDGIAWATRRLSGRRGRRPRWTGSRRWGRCPHRPKQHSVGIPVRIASSAAPDLLFAELSRCLAKRSFVPPTDTRIDGLGANSNDQHHVGHGPTDYHWATSWLSARVLIESTEQVFQHSGLVLVGNGYAQEALSPDVASGGGRLLHEP